MSKACGKRIGESSYRATQLDAFQRYAGLLSRLGVVLAVLLVSMFRARETRGVPEQSPGQNVVCYAPRGFGGAKDPTRRASARAFGAHREGRHDDAIKLFESVLEAEYSRDVIDMSVIAGTERLLAISLMSAGMKLRADMCRIVARHHMAIHRVRRPGANASDSIAVPFPTGTAGP